MNPEFYRHVFDRAWIHAHETDNRDERERLLESMIEQTMNDIDDPESAISAFDRLIEFIEDLKRTQERRQDEFFNPSER